MPGVVAKLALDGLDEKAGEREVRVECCGHVDVTGRECIQNLREHSVGPALDVGAALRTVEEFGTPGPVSRHVLEDLSKGVEACARKDRPTIDGRNLHDIEARVLRAVECSATLRPKARHHALSVRVGMNSSEIAAHCRSTASRAA